jgi:hypothetical protein
VKTNTEEQAFGVEKYVGEITDVMGEMIFIDREEKGMNVLINSESKFYYSDGTDAPRHVAVGDIVTAYANTYGRGSSVPILVSIIIERGIGTEYEG